MLVLDAPVRVRHRHAIRGSRGVLLGPSVGHRLGDADDLAGIVELELLLQRMPKLRSGG